MIFFTSSIVEFLIFVSVSFVCFTVWWCLIPYILYVLWLQFGVVYYTILCNTVVYFNIISCYTIQFNMIWCNIISYCIILNNVAFNHFLSWNKNKKSRIKKKEIIENINNHCYEIDLHHFKVVYLMYWWLNTPPFVRRFVW